jgi:hypothetical protein
VVLVNDLMLPAGVDIRKTKAVAAGLGARDFRERPFFPDPYTVLDKSWSMAAESAAPTITDEQLRSKHRELQIKYHPDRHASELQPLQNDSFAEST